MWSTNLESDPWTINKIEPHAKYSNNDNTFSRKLPGYSELYKSGFSIYTN